MASQPQDRENLLRDATAFTTRLQLQVPSQGRTTEVFAGFRQGGAASFYFDQDPVYHFNTAGQLRRAFVDGYLVKAEAGRLVRLHRQRTESESAMIRDEMTSAEQQAFCQTVLLALQQLQQTLATGSYTLEGQVTATEKEDAVVRLAEYLEHLQKIAIADTPRVTS